MGDKNKEPGKAGNDLPETVTVPKEEFEGLKSQVGELSQKVLAYERFGTPQPVAPAEPAGPSVEDQIKEIDTQIEALDEELEVAVREGTGVKDLMKNQRALSAKRSRLEIVSQEIDPFRTSGMQALGQLTDRVTKGAMPHLTIPEVEKTYQATLQGLPEGARANPDTLMAAYKYAVGEHADAIGDARVEAAVREATETLSQQPSSTSARIVDSKGNEIPKPEDVLSKEALEGLRSVGRSVDEHYKKLGYKDWADYYEQNREYYEGEGE